MPRPPLTLPRPLVTADGLAERRDTVALVDARWYLDGRSGHRAYLGGHLPGAVWVDLDTDLSGAPSADGGRHPLPTPDGFAAAMSRLGIGDDTPVVVYDDAGGSIAARLWWMLHVLDHPVAVLDGGMAAWPGRLEVGEVTPTARPFTPRAWPAGRFADADAVDRYRRERRSVVLDARAPSRYEGGQPGLDPRPGHIPGARSAPWAANLDPSGRLAAPDVLAARYASLGADDAELVVAYCGSGVTACHDLLALAAAGRTATALFVGSWSAWGADPDRPAETGPDRR